ncbi:tail fiber protein [Methylococcus sp. EFPC2]|uniref:tail fiber protein n=1 Tax=Methylococcus sp. EFPC2 TaxID=2812648 RepID=UPI0019679F5E|nr:tail fiber protein [Methylococcus sp. EFPC2]QSA96431.1 tail fiber protein [Methylococcus sp. EFPC2]
MKFPFQALALSAALALAFQAQGETASPLLNYQGVLTESVPANGTVKLTFNLYDSAESQTAVWGPQVFDGVPVVGGRYGVILGSTDASGRPLAGVIGVKGSYLGVSVDGREIQPRQPIAQAAAAQTAVPPAAAGSPGSEGVPAGTIAAYWSSQAPAGWLLADGSPIPEGAQYDRLRAIVNGNLPDLRGLFLRGLGQNADPAFRYEGDAARTLAQFQQDEFKSHAHVFDDFTFSENTGVPGKAWGNSGGSDIDNTPGSPFSHSTAASGGGETRPKNAGVYWIIKY